jgi:hypothetical protein
MRFVGRIIVALFILGSGIQSILALLAIVLTFRNPNAPEEAIAQSIGFFVGSVLFLVFLVWLFRKIGPRKVLTGAPPVIKS